MYKPNFCAECGERVERVRWRMWTSRRFCAACERRLGRRRIWRTLVFCAVLWLAGFVLGRSTRPPAPPLLISRHGTAETTLTPLSLPAQTKATEAARPAAEPSAAPRYGPDGTAGERPTDPTEIVSICGARTKKGRPCSRRVRGTGRCWQHRGLPAMLPPGKLVIQGQ